MPTIRPIELDDLRDIEYVCRMTAGEKAQRDEKFGEIISKTFSTYYVKECRETCFCLADENNKAVGYILCEPSYNRYGKIFRKKYMPLITKLSKKSGFEAFFMPIPYKLFGKNYPAHMHIDILPQYQSKGYGKELLDTLFKALKEKNIKGLCLITGKSNPGAIRFYKRLGFKKLVVIGDMYAMGIRL